VKINLQKYEKIYAQSPAGGCNERLGLLMAERGGGSPLLFFEGKRF